MDKHKRFPIHQMAVTNLEAWMRSARTILMLLFIVSICYLEATYNGQMFKQMGREMHWDELFFYLMSSGCNIQISSVLFLVTVSELPRQMAYQYQHLIRANRTKWLASQCLYCIWTVLFVQIVINLFSGLFLIPYTVPGAGWSEPELVASGAIPEEARIFPLFICDKLTPFQGNLLAQLPIFSFRLTMVFIILMLSLYGHGLAGVIAYVFILMADRTILVEAFNGIVLPMNFATFSSIIATFTNPNRQWVTTGHELNSIGIAMGGHLAMLLFLVCLMRRRVRHCDLVFDGNS